MTDTGSRAIIVLGMHRSYTSLLSAWLHHNGVSMVGDVVIPGDSLYEDTEILKLHTDVLEKHGMNWLNARAPFCDEYGVFHARAREIWQRRSEQHTHWGWKEPRTSILYQDIWSSIAGDARVILIYRNPGEVVEFLFQRRIQEQLLAAKGIRRIPAITRWWEYRHRARYDHLHLNCWNYYNQCCLNMLSAKSPHDRVVVAAGELIGKEDQLRDILSAQWDIPLGTQRFTDLFKESSISSHVKIDAFRGDLIRDTKEILEALHKLRTFREIASS